MNLTKLNKTIISFLAIMAGILIINSSETLAISIKEGINLCISSVIPSLYIFTVFSLFIVKCKILDSPIFDFLTNMFFGFKGQIGIIYLLSLFCGYPIGAKLINEMAKNKVIAKNDAERMLLFCINPGPAFCISTIGIGCYANKNIGILLFSSITISSIIMIRLYHPHKTLEHKTIPRHINYGEGFTSSVNDANKCMVSICAWVILARAVINFLKPYNIYLPILCTIEVTFGAITASNELSIYFLAFLLGFGGFSVHLQILSNSREIKTKYYKILISRLASGILCSGILFVLLKIFPQSISVQNINLVPSMNENSPIASVCLVAFICTSLIFIQKRIKRTLKSHQNF